MKILIVDDSRTMRMMLKHALTPLGPVAFVEAVDGVEGLKAFATFPSGYDLVLVDWNMPHMNGLEMIGKVREIDKKTPIIMVTTEGEKDHVLDALRAGANSYVIKPFSPETLLAKTQQVLGKAKAA
jgi:two-component system chemotaxis response regulator CheY